MVFELNGQEIKLLTDCLQAIYSDTEVRGIKFQVGLLLDKIQGTPGKQESLEKGSLTASLVQLAKLADQLDSKGLKTEVNAIDKFLKEAMRAEVESGMDMLLTRLLDEYPPEALLQLIKQKIQNIGKKNVPVISSLEIKAEVVERKGKYTTVRVDDKGDHAIFLVSTEPFAAEASIESAEAEIAKVIGAVDSFRDIVQNLGHVL